MISEVAVKEPVGPTAIAKPPAGMASITLSFLGFAICLFLAGGMGPVNIQGLQFISSTISLILIAALVVLVSRRDGLAPHMGYLMLLFGALYWFVAPAFFISLKPDYELTSRYGMMLRPQSVAIACVYVSGYLAISVLAYWICYPFALRRSLKSELSRSPDKIYLILFALFLAGFVPYLLFGGGIENVIHAMLAGRSERPPWKSGSLGDQRSALYYLSRSGMVAAAGFAGTWALLAREARYKTILLAMLGVTSFLVFFDGGTRSWAALAAVPTALAWIAYTVKGKFTLGRLVLFFVVLVTIQLTFEFARASRNHGWSLENIKYIDPIKREFDNDFFSELSVAIEMIPRRHDYFHFGDTWAFFSHPVPRFLWRDKPISPVLMFYNDAVFKGLLSGSGNKLPSHLGQFHMSFGWFGIVIVGIMTGIIGAYSSAMMRSEFAGLCHLGAALATWWFIMGRGVYPGWTYVVLFAWLIVALGFRKVRKTHAV